MGFTSSWSTRLQRAWGVRGGAVLLLPLAWCFGALAALRRLLYRTGLLRTTAIDVPVVIVGNLIVGGAGKTPTVLAVVRLLQQRGHRPGIVSRGHGRAADSVLDVSPDTPARDCGDEPLLLRLRAGVPVCVARDRVAAAQALRRWHPQVDVVVSDDGLQHLRLARDVQIIVFDERGAGNGWLLPAGPLREPLPARVPARSLVLYNAPRPSTPLPGWTARRGLAGAVELADWWRGAPCSPAALDALAARPLVAAAGTAQPQRFFALLRERGLQIAELPLPDHHDYATLPWPPGSADVIVTEKDAVKLDPTRVAPTRIWVAALDFAPEAGFDAALMALLPPPASGVIVMETRLLELLVCPICKGPLEHRRPPQHERQELVCHADHLAFPVRDGIPVMLEAEARPLANDGADAGRGCAPVSFTVLLPARLASTRLPNKPLADIGGAPMIVRVAQRAALSSAAAVVVAADAASIVAACAAHGVRALLTRDDHATGSDRLAEACTLLGLDGDDVVVNVQGDEPLIAPDLIDACAALLERQRDCVMATAAHTIAAAEEIDNPNVVKVVLDAAGRALYFSRAPIPWWRDGRARGESASTPLPLRHVGIYAYRAGFLRRFPSLEAAPLERIESLEQLRVLWHGERIAVHVTADAPGPGVDTPADLERVRALYRP